MTRRLRCVLWATSGVSWVKSWQLARGTTSGYLNDLEMSGYSKGIYLVIHSYDDEFYLQRISTKISVTGPFAAPSMDEWVLKLGVFSLHLLPDPWPPLAVPLSDASFFEFLVVPMLFRTRPLPHISHPNSIPRSLVHQPLSHSQLFRRLPKSSTSTTYY